MYKYAVLGMGFLLLLGVVSYALFQDKSTENITGSVGEILSPFIVIESGTVSAVRNGVEEVLAQGDSILTPTTLKSGPDTKARVQFPDGSELRLDVMSELEITSATYAKTDGELVVKARLKAGRVWSSIIGLVTPGSAWEVETSNVVATVRGTAFSTAIGSDKATTLWGSQSTVGVDVIDPTTNQRSGKGGTVTENEYIIIGTSTATKIVNGDITFKPLPLTSEIENDPWFVGNEKEDKEIREWIQTRNNGSSDGEVRNRLYEELKTKPAVPQETSPEEASEEEEEVSKEEEAEKPEEPITEDSSIKEIKTEPVAPKPVTGTTSIRPLSLTIVTNISLQKGVDEGTNVTLAVEVTMSNNTKRTITDGVTFQVAGPIGTVRGNIFYADLLPSVEEYGKYSGGIAASWTDPVSGVTLSGKTNLFEVRTKSQTLIEQG